jgi:hypothetical protein
MKLYVTVATTTTTTTTTVNPITAKNCKRRKHENPSRHKNTSVYPEDFGLS